jgi:hypothetical protein
VWALSSNTSTAKRAVENKMEVTRGWVEYGRERDGKRLINGYQVIVR